jgi:TPR repeat protein
MAKELIMCMSLPPATILSVPIYNFAIANQGLADMDMHVNYPCCGKRVCGGCVHTFLNAGNDNKCPFCNSKQGSKTDEEKIEEVMKRVEANDPSSINLLANHYLHGHEGFQQDRTKAIELYTKAAGLGFGDSHYQLGSIYNKGGDLKKAKFHHEAAAMAGDEVARNWLGEFEGKSGNLERAIQHFTIAASAGHFTSMNLLMLSFQQGYISRESIDSTLTAYNHSCAEMRSEARDAYINLHQLCCRAGGVGWRQS